MKILLVLLFCCPQLVSALESSDRLSTRILKVYDKNILILNRGLEDGVFPKDHIKLTSSDGFIARGICIKVGMLSSHYKIYRVIRPELVSKDTNYILSSINQSKMPKDIRERYKKVDFTNYFKDWDEKNLSKQIKLQQERFAKYDLPEDTSNDEVLKLENKSKAQKFLSKNFSSSVLKDDFSTWYLKLYASPYSIESLNDQRESNFGFEIFNLGKKYDFNLQFNSFRRKLVDPFTDNEVDRARKEYTASFEIKDFSENWNFISMLRYDDARYGNIGTPREHYQLGLFGIKYIFDYQDEGNLFDLSYLFFLDQRQDDALEEIIGSSTFKKVPQTFNNARHGIRLRVRGYFDNAKKYSFDNELWWQPLFDLTSRNTNFSDTDMYNRLRLSYRAGENLFLDYENHYSNDINQEIFYNLPQIVTTNVFNLRYQFDL
jgi:hypothetical protein